jgi:serine/threonine protein kinase/Flp pilus assembly protein TadD
MSIKCPKCHFENPDDSLYCVKCDSPLAFEEDISATKTLEMPVDQLSEGFIFAGRYKIIEELGKGGMGRVYKVTDNEIEEEIALKFLKHEVASDEKNVERFRNELKLARRVSHKHVCRLYDLGKENDEYFITMEYVEGEDLKNLIRRKKKISPDEAILIAKQVCEGMAEAHRLGIVHRDLKSQNIMIDEEGNAKIMDFGIARSLGAPGVTATGMVVGTPDYISPEQAEGEEADNRSDIYSFGVILYEMVTGSVPFRGDTAFSVALKHKTQLPQDPRKLNPDVSEDLSRLILICMEKDRERRFQTAEDILADLRNIEEGFPLGTKIRPRKRTFVATIIQNKFFIPALVATLIIIAIAVWQLQPQKEDKPSITVLPFDDLSPNKDQYIQCEGLSDTIITALNQLDNLYIPGRQSSFSFKGQEINYQEIGRKLNVDSVLEGSIQEAGTQLRIVVWIKRISDEKQIWGKVFTGEKTDIFDIQDQIVLAVVDNLGVIISGEERTRLVKRFTENAEARELYLTGMYYLQIYTMDGFSQAIEYLSQASKKDPSYPLPYFGLAAVYSIMSLYGNIPPHELGPKAKEYAEKALELDPNLAEAHALLGNINTIYDWDWKKAEERFKKALQLNPNSAETHMYYSFYLTVVGRFGEAIDEAKQARKLDPRHRRIIRGVGNAFFYDGQFERAIEEYKKTLNMYPNDMLSHLMLGRIYQEKTMIEEAIYELETAVDVSGRSPVPLCVLGFIYYMAGKKIKAEKLFEEYEQRSRQKYVPPIGFFYIYLFRGDYDKAAERMEKTCEGRDPFLLYFIKDPTKSFRIPDESRFNEILRRYGLR